MLYIPLNIKTHYSLLKSLIKIDDLISYALKNKIYSLGITDENMFGTMEFLHKCQKNNIKAIIGIELEIEETNFLIYAKNYNGYTNLCKIVSEKNTSKLTFSYIKENSEDLICVTKSKNYELLKEYFKETFISYQNKNEKVEALVLTDKIIFLTESLYFEEKDAPYMKYLTMIREGKTIDDYVEDITSKSLYFDIDPLDLETINSFISLIDLTFPEHTLSLPNYSENNVDLIYSLCKKGITKRLNGIVPTKYVERLKYELSVIENMGFIDYFLIVYDFVLFAKKNNIVVGPGRGSAAGSLVSYSLGITDIDPIKYDLIFERFLNKDRVTMPDIDIDFEYLRRNEVVDYVKEKYGYENVANIITFGTLLSKQVLRDTGRILNIPVKEMDAIVKKVKDKEPLKELKQNKDFMALINTKPEYIKLLDIASKFENLKRHTSIHAAGVVLSSSPLKEKLPLYKSGNTILTGYSMEYLEELGLLKMDFLAIRDLTTIDSVRKLVSIDKGIELNLNDIPLNDAKTIELFNKVDTVGIFQFESEGMKGFLQNLKINSFEDIVSAIALYRPGPRENIDSFIRRRNGIEKVKYIHPLLEPILKSTYGIMVYQEQIIEILKQMGNFTYSEADNIRRAMSKKKENVILEYKNKFIKGALSKGIDEKTSREVYDLVLKFANYGFNKSHSVAYSLVAFKMAYLKAHYKEYFMANELNLVIGNAPKTKEYIDETRSSDIDLSILDINISEKEYIVKDGKIIFPFGIIKNIGKEITSEIIKERESGLFTDYYDAVTRLFIRKINKQALENLILSGTFDSFNLTRKTMIENLENVINYATLIKDLDASLVNKPALKEQDEYNQTYLMEKEYELFGFYIKNHPVTKYKREIYLNNIKKYFDKHINLICLIDYKKEIITKSKETMCFLNVSDEYSKISVVIFPKTYKSCNYIQNGNIIKLNGRVERRMNNYQIIANNIEVLK